MEKVTIVVTTFNRPKKAAACVRSIRAKYPDTKILVIDCGRSDPALAEACRECLATRCLLEYDAGIGDMRNTGIMLAKTPYVAIIEDDFIFSDETDIEKWVKVLDGDDRVAFVAGSLIYTDYGKPSTFANMLKADWAKGVYQIVKITEPEWLEVAGVRYHHADYVYNFGLLRKDSGMRWDADYKTCIEHVAFALEVQKSGRWTCAVVPDVVAIHDKEKDDQAYVDLRHRLDSWEAFRNKTGMKHGINDGVGWVYDFVGKKVLSYPEYVFALIRARGKS